MDYKLKEETYLEKPKQIVPYSALAKKRIEDKNARNNYFKYKWNDQRVFKANGSQMTEEQVKYAVGTQNDQVNIKV